MRTIAPYIKNKLVDPAVLSVDEGGNFVIPLLSGHIGGANGFAKVLAKVIKATPVVTTATDVNKLFAVDEWAARNNMIINSMKAAKDFNVDLEKSWMIGDGENDVLAGKNAGCKTVLIGNQDYQQDYTVSSLKEFVDRVL